MRVEQELNGGHMVQVRVDTEADCAYVYLKEEIGDGEACQNFDELLDPADVEADVVVDLDADGHLLGVEIVGASVLLSSPVMNLSEEISDLVGGDRVRPRLPVYLDMARDVLRAPLGQKEWVAAARVLRLPLPAKVAGWVELHLDGEGHLLRVEVGRASRFVHPDALADAIRV